MVIETVEISTPAEESPAVSWAAIAAGAIAAAALTLVLLAFGAGMGFSAVSPWGNVGISASTFQIGTGIYLIVVAMLASAGHWRLYRGAFAYQMGRCPCARSLLSRHRSWLSGMGVRHGNQHCVLGCRCQQHCRIWIVRICTDIRRPRGLLRGCAVALQFYRKPG